MTSKRRTSFRSVKRMFVRGAIVRRNRILKDLPRGARTDSGRHRRAKLHDELRAAVRLRTARRRSHITKRRRR